MADVIELRPGARRPILTPAETLQGPFVTAMNSHYERLLAVSAKAHYREGYDQGVRDGLPVMAIVGALCVWIGWAFS